MNGRWKWTQDFSVVTRAKTTGGNPPRWQREAEAEGRVGMVFCPSLSDFFHPGADQWRSEAWAVIKSVPAAAHYLAAEPLLEDLMPDLAGHMDGVDWVVLGGETGSGVRPMDPQWARNVRDLCRDRGIAFWFLGHGGMHQKGTLLDGVQHKAYPARLYAPEEKKNVG